MYEGGSVSYPTYIPPVPAPPVPPVSLVQDWTEAALATEFSANGNANGNPAFRVLSILGSTKVEWRGGIGITYASGSIANGGLFLTNPLAFIPSVLRTVPCACSAASSAVNSLKIDFQTDGTAKIVGTNTTTINPPWLSLNGVGYYL
jgi:hypothetical protein